MSACEKATETAKNVLFSHHITRADGGPDSKSEDKLGVRNYETPWDGYSPPKPSYVQRLHTDLLVVR